MHICAVLSHVGYDCTGSHSVLCSACSLLHGVCLLKPEVESKKCHRATKAQQPLAFGCVFILCRAVSDELYPARQFVQALGYCGALRYLCTGAGGAGGVLLHLQETLAD